METVFSSAATTATEVGEGRFFIKRTDLTLSRPFPDSSLWDFSSNIHWWVIEELPDLSYTLSLIFGFLNPLSDCRHRWGCVWLRFQPLHKTSHPHKL